MRDLSFQAAKLRSLIYDDTFRYCVGTIRKTCMSHEEFSSPAAKPAKAFTQQSPLGHTRIVADAASIEEHISRSLRVNSVPKYSSLDHAPPDLIGAVKVVSSFKDDPASLVSKRKAIQGILSHVAVLLAPHQIRLEELMPDHVKALPSLHRVALIAAISEAIRWPDELLVAKLVFGSPVSGELPPSNVFRPKVKTATVDPADFDCHSWVLQLEKSIFQRGSRLTRKGAAAAELVLQKSIAETTPVKIGDCDTGRSWAEGPFSRRQVYDRFPDGFWPQRRFPVEQKGDIRPCDDARESLLNASASLAEAVSSDGADFPSIMADLFYSFLGEGLDLHGGCSDWKKAYRQCPTDDPSRSVVAQWDPQAKKVVYFVTHGHLFGQTCAVNSFNAVAKFLTCSARRLFACCGGNYFDDHIVSEPSFADSSGQIALTFLADLCGFLFDPDKHVPMQSKFVYLGVLHDYSSLACGVMRVRILPARRANLVDACRCVLKSGHLSPGAAASLRGKLYFAATAAYGKVGRAALQPGLQRQEQSGDSNRLTPSLVLSLRFFITLLNNMPTRKLLTP